MSRIGRGSEELGHEQRRSEVVEDHCRRLIGFRECRTSALSGDKDATAEQFRSGIRDAAREHCFPTTWSLAAVFGSAKESRILARTLWSREARVFRTFTRSRDRHHGVGCGLAPNCSPEVLDAYLLFGAAGVGSLPGNGTDALLRDVLRSARRAQGTAPENIIAGDEGANACDVVEGCSPLSSSHSGKRHRYGVALWGASLIRGHTNYAAFVFRQHSMNVKR